MSQPSQHDADHGEVDPGFFTARKNLIVLGEPAPGGEPGERSLDNPSPFEHAEPPRAGSAPNSLRLPPGPRRPVSHSRGVRRSRPPNPMSP